MKLNCKRIDLPYTPGEEIFIFPEESGLSFLFDVDEELTDDPAAMDAVGEMLDEAEELAEKAKAAIKAALADEDSPYHSVAAFFMEFGYCGGTFSGNRSIQAVLCRDGGLFAAQAVWQPGGQRDESAGIHSGPVLQPGDH